MRQPNKRLGKGWEKQSKPRKKAKAPTKKHWFKCTGGAFDGQKILLTDGYTMVFTASGFTGRYVPEDKNNLTNNNVRFESC